MTRTRLCRHIKTNGRQCGSPSLEEKQWCYFHNRLHQTHRAFRHKEEQTSSRSLPGEHMRLLALEDLESVQVAISAVINALASGELKPKPAATLLYGLQIASTNATRINKSSAPDDNPVLSSATTPDGLDYADGDTELDREHLRRQEMAELRASETPAQRSDRLLAQARANNERHSHG